MQNYATLHENHEADEEGGVLVHVAEPSRARWNHIEDLDSFFFRMYQYHQRHGFICMLLKDILSLIEFVFIVVLTCILCHGINYARLFANPLFPPPADHAKTTLSDVIYPFSETIANFGALTWCVIVLAFFVWILKLIKSVYHLFHFWDIKQFYNTALKVADADLDNLTWHEIQTKVKAVQIEQQMCIHKRELTELDIYHRILRQTNYLIAMVNKRLLPPRLHLPVFGEWVYYSTGLKYNIQILFFWSPWSAFAHPWQLREEYRKPNLRHELAQELGKQILWLALANLLLCPIIFVWQMLYAFFNYAAIIRREPSILAVRRWSLYGRMYLRHFNELEHELKARLTRAYKPATKYLGAFVSPVGTIVSESLGFYATACLAVFVALSLYDEDVLAVEHVLTIITGLSVAVAILRNVGPDEITTQDLGDLMKLVWLHTHYLPTHWEGQAHTSRVRREFEQLFQYGFVSMLEDILSPVLTPYILWRHIYPRSIEFVDFFRSFTVNVVGVGDVCSFAQMDVRKHGHPDWHEEEIEAPDQYSQCEDGKVELSLIHFKCTNPSWKPPSTVEEFVRNVQAQSMVASEDLVLNRRLDESQMPRWRIGDQVGSDVLPPSADIPLYTSDVWRARAPDALHISNMWTNEGPSLNSVREMTLNANYLHGVHQSRTEGRGGSTARSSAQETTPLLFSNR